MMCLTPLFSQETVRDGSQLTYCQQKALFRNKIHPQYFYNATSQLAGNYEKKPEQLVNTSQTLRKKKQQKLTCRYYSPVNIYYVYIYFKVHFLEY